MAPDLFAQVILVEPILFQMDGQTDQIARLAMKRRDTWASLWVKRIDPALLLDDTCCHANPIGTQERCHQILQSQQSHVHVGRRPN